MVREAGPGRSHKVNESMNESFNNDAPIDDRHSKTRLTALVVVG